MPNKQEVISIRCCEINSYTSLANVPPDSTGYIIAPFKASSKYPVYVYNGIDVSVHTTDDFSDIENVSSKGIVFHSDKENYKSAFLKIKHYLKNGEANKIVLARKESAHIAKANHIALFLEACSKYPHCYIALIKVPQHGVWLTATPELLYKANKGYGYTTALAGTMPWRDFECGKQWSTKNIKEQQMVTDYIRSRLITNNITFSSMPPNTIKAGALAHLRTDFTLDACQHGAVELLQLLHPTPAVAGAPLQSAIKAIEHAESENFRQYYSGFSGFLNHEEYGTQCYVSLRLMHFDNSNNVNLYAGGGILPESTLEQEWHETALKLQTMKSLFDV